MIVAGRALVVYAARSASRRSGPTLARTRALAACRSTQKVACAAEDAPPKGAARARTPKSVEPGAAAAKRSTNDGASSGTRKKAAAAPEQSKSTPAPALKLSTEQQRILELVERRENVSCPRRLRPAPCAADTAC
jgi:hypothetical protein